MTDAHRAEGQRVLQLRLLFIYIYVSEKKLSVIRN